MLKVEISQGVFVSCSLDEGRNGEFILQCDLRRRGRLGLKIYERVSKKEEVEDLIKRPRWLGEESDRVLRRALSLLLERMEDAGSLRGSG